MTRINLISVKLLSNQHLVAEYRELPRVIKQNLNLKDAPKKYCLGKGHMKWARKHALFCLNRYREICKEMERRGFTINFSYQDLKNYYDLNCPNEIKNDYIPTLDDIRLSQDRINERLAQKPDFYTFFN